MGVLDHLPMLALCTIPLFASGAMETVAVSETSAVEPFQNSDKPMLLGVDDAGNYFQGSPDIDRWNHEPYLKALHELGLNFMVIHLMPVEAPGLGPAEALQHRIGHIDEAMRREGIRYALNNELANWWKVFELEPGKDEFAHPDGTHRWDLRMDWLRPLLQPQDGRRPVFEGVVYDEPVHMQLCGQQFATHPGGEPLDAPYLADTEDMSVEQAYEALTAAAVQIRVQDYGGQVRLSTEQVMPDLFHIYARAGWTIGPKLLKEHLTPVVISIALGAAVQYADTGTALWVSPDLWGRGDYPGHSPNALRSALLMGYWLGSEAIYVENLDWPQSTQRHPEAEPGSLLDWQDDNTYRVTKHGQVVKSFYRDYIPAHPRNIDWRDYRPRVAIIRLPDGAWGQWDTGFRDRLLGMPDHPMDAISAEWLKVWPILTHGAASPLAIGLNNGKAYPTLLEDFLVPIDSVAVFDHRVAGQVLDSVDCFIVCGHALTDATFEAVRERVVESGATCVIARRLYERHAPGSLPGKWVIVDTFEEPVVAEALAPFLGPDDVARYRFARHVVEFRRGKEHDAVEVEIRERH
jgi:hypothetical protein